MCSGEATFNDVNGLIVGEVGPRGVFDFKLESIRRGVSVFF